MKTVFDKHYDVAVVGAGVAGVAAAVAAARRGRKVAVIEKQTLIGGLATSGLIFVYLPLCDGFGTQVIGGLSEEMLRKCCEFGPFDLHRRWGGESRRAHRRGGRFEVEFSPAGFTLTLDEMLAEAGVDLWLDSRVCDVELDGGRVVALAVENTSGRGRVTADCFVDASGEAVLVRRAGGRVSYEVNHHTMWAMEYAPDASQYHIAGALHVKPFNFGEPDFAPGEACDGKRVTDFTRLAWKHLREFYRESVADGRRSSAEHFPVHLPAMPQFRKIAAIAGREVIGTAGNQKRVADSVGLTGDWRLAGPVWETPFGALVPEAVDGVFAAGRCINAVGDAWEVYRVIPTAAMTGEAAGIAAAIASERGCAASEVTADEVRGALRELGVKLHMDEVNLPYGVVPESDLPAERLEGEE